MFNMEVIMEEGSHESKSAQGPQKSKCAPSCSVHPTEVLFFF